MTQKSNLQRLQQTLNQLVKSSVFTHFTTFVIVGYAVVLGLKTYDYLLSSYEYVFYILDRIVTFFFLVEIILKMASEKKLWHFFKDGWNIFDFVIVVVSLIPINEGDYALIARLLRLFRVLRLLTARPKLKAIVEVLFKSIPAIFDVVLLLFIIFYLYAVVGTSIFGHLESKLWVNVSVALLTLFRILTFEDWTDVMYEAMQYNPYSWIFFVSFVVIAAFIFFNLFVAVIISEMQKFNEEQIEQNFKTEDEKLDTIIDKLQSLEEEIKVLKQENHKLKL